ncbi:MAG TPA: SRPBCC domain-containing protein [Steroidobacteraceae bacterium]
MSDPVPQTQAWTKFDRRYEDTNVQDLWDLWATKDGFESWWGPQGFRGEVQRMDSRTGGELVYDMIAYAPEQVAALKQMNLPLAHTARGIFEIVEPLKRLVMKEWIDFVPDVKPYTIRIEVEFFQEGSAARMVISVEPHHSAEWTRLAKAGMDSQLSKLPGALSTQR